MAKQQNTLSKKTSGISTRNPEKYEYAYMLYMQRRTQAQICESVGISPATFQKWKTDGGWEVKRAASTISTDTLIAKILQRADELVDSGEGFNADALAKTLKPLKDLKNGASLNDMIEIFMKFGDWLIERIPSDPDLSPEFVKLVTKYQDKFILNRMQNGS